VLRIGAGVVAVGATVLLLLLAPDPAVLVLGVGVLAVAALVGRGRLTPARAIAALDAPVIAGLFGIAVALGTVGRSWGGPSHLLGSSDAPTTAAVATAAAVLLNNLPAAALLAARPVAHPRALLIGLNVGPNLAVTGSLSALLWFNTARRAGVRPNIATVSRVGLILVPLSIAAALLATSHLASGGLSRQYARGRRWDSPYNRPSG
jgi:arsenical pump membrane protein